MEAQKWEELSRDCLVKVFECVGLESLVLDLPFVCKSWYKASLDPQCWKHIDFHFMADNSDPSFIERVIKRYGISKFSNISFFQFVGSRSGRSATYLALPFYFSEDTLLDCLAEEFPEVKHLQVTDPTANAKDDFVSHYVSAYFKFSTGSLTLSTFVWKFKHLEELTLVRTSSRLEACLKDITLNCCKLISFCTQGYITEEDAMAIVTHISKIKKLNIKGCVLTRKVLLVILKGCRELEYLNISKCVGFEIDEELLGLATHIKAFFFDNCKDDENVMKQFRGICDLRKTLPLF